jgi:hypothetical protein
MRSLGLQRQPPIHPFGILPSDNLLTELVTLADHHPALVAMDNCLILFGFGILESEDRLTSGNSSNKWLLTGYGMIGLYSWIPHSNG